MPEYLSPGVYVEEVQSGPRPISGVGTSTAGMVGLSERGPSQASLITSWGNFLRLYGDIGMAGSSFLAAAVRGFFDNGGQKLFVARVNRSDAVATSANLMTSNASQDVVMNANGLGDWGNGLFIRISAATKSGFRITILYFATVPNPFVDPLDRNNIGDPNRVEPDLIEDYDNLDYEATGNNYFINRINSSSVLVRVSWSDANQATARPNDQAFTQLATNGDNGVAVLTSADFEGDPSIAPDSRVGLASLELIDEIALLSIPDHVNTALLDQANRDSLTNALINQCEVLRDRFAILNVEQGQGVIQNILPAQVSSYAAIYYPWVYILNPTTNETMLVPPCGHVTGIYAKTDIDRGVHKAPANVAIAGLARSRENNDSYLEYNIARLEQDILNPRGVNVIRNFIADRRGIRVWGARTLSDDPLWRYVNVRRLFLFVEESIDEGTQWVVFEPNDDNTWARVRQVISNFLNTVWRSGALQGLSAEQAYFVRCGLDTMTQADIDDGKLICEIGIAPVKPAEFVIFRISHKSLQSA